MKKILNREEINALRLSDAERSLMRANLVAHMAANPLPTPSPYSGILSPFQYGSLRPFAFALVALFMVGASTVIAAEGSLPGDLLYPVKINIIERVEAAFATSAESKAAFAVELADRRMGEVAQLNASASSTPIRDEESRARVVKAAKYAEDAIAELENENPQAAAQENARFSATLEAHSDTLENLSVSGSVDATETSVNVEVKEELPSIPVPKL